MPSHKAGNFKQRNKPFKGSNKNKIDVKTFGIPSVTKKIQKMEKPQTKDARLNKLRQLRENKIKSGKEDGNDVLNESMLRDVFIELRNKMPSAPKIVLLAGFNEGAQPELIKQQLAELLGANEDIMVINEKSATDEGKVPHEFSYLRLATSNKISPELKTENYIVIVAPRNLEIFLDYCKIADIVGIVLSCKDADQSSLLLDPFENAKAFDELGYKMLTSLRAQGFPTSIGIVQDLELIAEGKQAAVKKIFNRFYESEIGKEEKVVTLNNSDSRTLISLMRILQEATLKELEWREMRSYLMAEKLHVNPSNQVLEIEGFLKGSCFNPNQLIHITGYGDYQVMQIDILHNPFMQSHRKQKLIEEVVSLGLQPDDKVLASFNSEENQIEDFNMFPDQGAGGIKKFKEKQESILAGLTTEEVVMGENNNNNNNNQFEEEKMIIEANKPNKKTGGNRDRMIEEKPTQNFNDRMFDENEEQPEIQDEQSDISFDEEPTAPLGSILEEKKKMRQLKMREDDEKNFEDEVDYPSDVRVSERFKKYKALKSFKTTEWNPYIDLPIEYEKILIFDDFSKSKRLALEKAQKEAVTYRGFYVKIYVYGFPIDNLATHNKERPILVSSLLAHERKVTVMNLKVHRYLESADVVRSKETLEVHMGFRIFTSQPLFSKISFASSKSKYERKTYKDQTYMATMYGEVTFPPANALVFKTNEHGYKDLVASGELMKPDPLRVMLKRIILTGYPLKVHKRSAVIRMMFFNVDDVNYFKDVELVTKNGLRGFIKESLGTHGLMKCVFNSPVKHNDIVCLYLYKRVFPKWPFEPIQPSVMGTEDLMSLLSK